MLPPVKYSVLFSLACIALKVVKSTNCQSRDFCLFAGKNITSNVLSEDEVETRYQCMDACDIEDACTSFNFNVATQICQVRVIIRCKVKVCLQLKNDTLPEIKNMTLVEKCQFGQQIVADNKVTYGEKTQKLQDCLVSSAIFTYILNLCPIQKVRQERIQELLIAKDLYPSPECRKPI